MNGKMKALGLHQPYAALIRCGFKTIETRFWSTAYRGPVVFCSTRGTYTDSKTLLETVRNNGYDVPIDALQDVGTIQCVAEIVDCRLGTTSDEALAFAPLFVEKDGVMVQKYSFVLQNIRPVVRKPVRCGRKWFTVDDAMIEYEL